MFDSIKIDSREQKRAFRMKEYFSVIDCPVSIEQLPVGDYVFNDKVVYELKTWSDFFNSVQNQTVFNEIFNQSRSYPYSFLIIYGDRNGELGDLYWKVPNFQKRFINKYKFDSWVNTNINGAVRRCRTACNIIFCEGEKTAAFEMLKQSEKCIMEKEYAGKVRPMKNNNNVVSFLTTINGVSLKKANTIVKELNIKTLKDLCNISKEDLLSIDGFGEKTVNKILEVVR